MQSDPTEAIRREEQRELNQNVGEREELEKRYGRVWNTEELIEEFEALGFLAPYVVVRVRASGKKGSLQFQHSPRLYFNFVEDGV